MKCVDARPLLDLLCDGALEGRDSALVLEHLEGCSDCSRQWHFLEQLHSHFQQAKESQPVPEGLLSRISTRLRDEERSMSSRFFTSFAGRATMTVAACVVLLLVVVRPWSGFLLGEHQAAVVLSADSLIDESASAASNEAVASRDDLNRKIGYEIKFVRLPDWQLERSAVCRPQRQSPIARFEFVRRSGDDVERLTCYQARQGSVQATGSGELRDLEGKKVRFGQHGKFHYALWSQNGRDYLFVTTMAEGQLEKVVSGT